MHTKELVCSMCVEIEGLHFEYRTTYSSQKLFLFRIFVTVLQLRRHRQVFGAEQVLRQYPGQLPHA